MRWTTLAATLPLLFTTACDVSFLDGDAGDLQDDAWSDIAAADAAWTAPPRRTSPRPTRAAAPARGAPPQRAAAALPRPAAAPVVLGAPPSNTPVAARAVAVAAPAPRPAVLTSPDRALAKGADTLSAALGKLGRLGQAVAVAPAPPPAVSLHGEVVAVIDGELVLARDQEVDAAWFAGAPRFTHRRGGDFRLTRPLAAAGLPARLSAWRGRRVALFDHRGQRCQATVGQLELRSRFEFHGNELAEDARAAFEANPGGGPLELTEPERFDPSTYGPERAWEAGTVLLVGTLSQVRGRCAGARLARLADAPPAALLTPAGRVDRALARRAVAIARLLPSYAAMASEADNWSAEGRRWDLRDGRKPEVRMLRDRRTGRQVLAVIATTYGPCDGEIRLTVLFEVTGRGRHAQLDLLAEQTLAPTLAALVDLDGDGHLEWLTRDKFPLLFEVAPTELRLELEAWISDLTVRGCPC